MLNWPMPRRAVCGSLSERTVIEDNVILEEIFRAVAELTDEERQLLRRHINQVLEKGFDRIAKII